MSLVRLLLLAGLPKGRIAERLGISLPTLNKHYFASGKISVFHAREMALAETRADNLLRIVAAAEKGNVGAMRTVEQKLDAAARDLAAEAARRAPPQVRAPRLGKKEIAAGDAQAAAETLHALLSAQVTGDEAVH